MNHCLLLSCPCSRVLFVIVHNYGRREHSVFLMHKSYFILYFSLEEILHPSVRASSVHESASVNLSLSTKKIKFLHPSSRASSVQESASAFSTPVEVLQLLKNLNLRGWDRSGWVQSSYVVGIDPAEQRSY